MKKLQYIQIKHDTSQDQETYFYVNIVEEDINNALEKILSEESLYSYPVTY